MNKADAARLIGAKESEIDSVEANDHGVVITAGGAQMIDVDPATPDGEGKSGLMLLNPADPAPFGFPVFVPATPDDEVDEETADAESDAGTDGEKPPPPAGAVEKPTPFAKTETWAAYAAAQGLDPIPEKRGDIIAALKAKETADAGSDD